MKLSDFEDWNIYSISYFRSNVDSESIPLTSDHSDALKLPDGNLRKSSGKSGDKRKRLVICNCIIFKTRKASIFFRDNVLNRESLVYYSGILI